MDDLFNGDEKRIKRTMSLMLNDKKDGFVL